MAESVRVVFLEPWISCVWWFFCSFAYFLFKDVGRSVSLIYSGISVLCEYVFKVSFIRLAI